MTTSPPVHCPQCGLALPADAPSGICPQCLLAQGMSPEPTRATSTPFTPPDPAELAAEFPQLEILNLIGQGGMGAVYRARQTHLERVVAVKILPPQVAADPAFSERFLREARALARLNHPNIVQVFDFGQAGKYFYLIMEYVDGVNLRGAIASGAFEPHAALDIVPQICEALQFAHGEGVVHRDIKPENILLDKRGVAKIADFGLAKMVRPGLPEDRPASPLTITGTHQVMGTVNYMAPEQIERPLAVDHRADIYSLGVVFYEMLTGELPLGRFQPPSHKLQVDLRIDDIVLKTLEKDPARRYQHASEVKTAVEATRTGPNEAYEQHVPPAVHPRKPPAKPVAAVEQPRFSRKAILGAVWAPLFLVAVVPVFMVRSSPPVVADRLLGMALIPFAILGVAAPVGTTILGMVALTDIRHSQGRIVGLPLALADALLYPLLILDGIVLVAAYVVGTWIDQWMDAPGDVSVALPLIMGFLVCAVLDAVIIVFAWRAASRDARHHPGR